MSIAAVIWLFPVVFLIHDGEEILTVERWIRAHQHALRQRFGGRRLTDAILQRAEATTTARFSTIVAVLFAAICLASYLATAGSYLWFAAGLAVLFINVFTHIGQALVFGGYTPGVATAVAVALPYSVYAYARLLTAEIITWSTVWLSVPVGAVMVGLLFLAGNALGRLLFPAPQHG